MTNQWLDISMPLTDQLAPFPGDKPFHYQLSYTKAETGACNIGELTTSLHNGTHLDAPFHYDNSGQTIDEIDLDVGIGPCLVLNLTNQQTITVALLRSVVPFGTTRLLLHTMTRTSYPFPREFPLIAPDVPAFLKTQGVRLLGIDAPSVDPEDSKTLPRHHALYQEGIYILENLVLNDVVPGRYQLFCAPLKIIGADASPVRALLKRSDDLNT
ncbi:kynurenine formamidase [Streptohalobacillus salinus]|uniref:Kynurenine formamidase n=1 Tax=Streptohalobacillus salinus TaxID=621096 RepID=A0A2V3W2H7_9BACI|nr:cyclase family protein [Streptohalobacillus salinus]PXW87318.1 kynurenine formamidase [Streptohalobacillus salinus]